MIHDDIIQYYDYLMRLAMTKCNSQNDAEDLVGDTLLAAFAYINRGGIIEYPKTWLANTLYHKHNDNLRKKYRAPITICLDECVDISENIDDEYFSSQEAAKIRKELNHLGYITREVLIRYYFGNQSVAEIADGLTIPEGTVKSRLSTGRNQMRKGLETMETRENYLPGEMYLSFGGAEGLKGEPMSLVDGDLIAKNILTLAYEKPVTVSELSKTIGIPAAYIEPIIKKLVDGELMVQTDSGKIYSDFIITKPQNSIANFKPQIDFTHKHFEKIWDIVNRMSEKISALSFVQKMEKQERVKLDRYAILKALQDFEHYGTGKIQTPNFPKRKDGGWWIAQAIVFDAGYNMKVYNEVSQYQIHGGHRTSRAVSLEGTESVCFYEFDTTLWDSPHRYGGAYELYFEHIVPLLWYGYKGLPLETSNIPNEFISYLPCLENFGLIVNKENKLQVSVPVLKRTEYDEVCALIKGATDELKNAIGEEFGAFIASMKTPIPKHLTSVPELFRYIEATKYFVMAVVREAYDKGLHLKDVDYCCPPVVLVYS